jgi:hypothetical protein
MGNLLFIDSDDINGLSDALRNALERRGVRFRNGGFDFPTTDDEIPDIDPFYGDMPGSVHISGGSCGGGGCGRAYVESYGGCGAHIEPLVHHSGGSCGDSYYYPRC